MIRIWFVDSFELKFIPRRLEFPCKNKKKVENNSTGFFWNCNSSCPKQLYYAVKFDSRPTDRISRAHPSPSNRSSSPTNSRRLIVALKPSDSIRTLHHPNSKSETKRKSSSGSEDQETEQRRDSKERTTPMNNTNPVKVLYIRAKVYATRLILPRVRSKENKRKKIDKCCIKRQRDEKTKRKKK